MTTNARDPRDRDSWARPVEKLTTTATGASMDTVTGRRVSGPVQGFGQMWQKTFRVRLTGVDLDPEATIEHWKAVFPTLWPSNAAFYAPLAGIAPGEVALLEVAPAARSPVKMSTGVLVIYADRESFTFMTPEGHAVSAWITFSASREDDTTVAQAQVLERTSDPLIDLTYVLGAKRVQDRFWEQTLFNLASSLGVAEPVVESQKICVDRRRQWRYVRNVRHSAAINMAVGTVTAPVRWMRGRRPAGD